VPSSPFGEKKGLDTDPHKNNFNTNMEDLQKCTSDAMTGKNSSNNNNKSER
jgi:hypothetical protein